MFPEGNPRTLQLGLEADSVKIRRKNCPTNLGFFIKVSEKILNYLLQPDSFVFVQFVWPYLWVFPRWHLLLSTLLPQPDPFTPFNPFTPNLCCLVKGPHGLVIHYSYYLPWLQQGSIATSSNWAKNASIKNINTHINQKLYKIGPIYKHCTWNFQHFVF